MKSGEWVMEKYITSYIGLSKVAGCSKNRRLVVKNRSATLLGISLGMALFKIKYPWTAGLKVSD